MKKQVLCSLLLFIMSFVAISQIKKPDGKSLSPAVVDQLVTDLMKKAEVTGLSLGIINNNRPVFIKAYGFKNKTMNQHLDTAASLYAASLAKPLFGYLVLQMVDKGMLNLDTPLYRYLPKPLPQYDNYKDLANDERWKLITARHCLSHTTGFPNWREFTQSKKLSIGFTPGKFYSYSGEGIELLQMVLEVKTGRKLEEMAQENIFKPFGMRLSSFVWQPAFEKNYAVGHNISEDTIAKVKRNDAHAAGSMETTIADYTRFMAAAIQGKRLSSKMYTQMLSPQIAVKYSNWAYPPVEKDSIAAYGKIGLSYGLGWGLFRTKVGKAFFKEGQIDGWEHYVIGFPEKKIAFVIMTNSSNGESIFKELTEKLTGITIPWEWEGYTPYRPVATLSAAQLQQFTGTYDGRLKAIITLENGQLKVSSPTVGLPKTNIYAANDHHLFLKIMDANFEFIKGPNGKFEKIQADDEGEKYELKRTSN
ncbi:MAG: serine hydrolase [Chitinophagaceae bacterium]